MQEQEPEDQLKPETEDRTPAKAARVRRAPEEIQAELERRLARHKAKDLLTAGACVKRAIKELAAAHDALARDVRGRQEETLTKAIEAADVAMKAITSAIPGEAL